MTEKEARSKILGLVEEYYNEHVKKDGAFEPGSRIAYSGRVFDEKEMKSLVDSALDFWLTAGRFSEQFEKEIADYLGVKYAHAVNSGSSANLIAFAVLTSNELGDRRIKPGDEVITPAASFPTTVAPIIQYGAVPVFVDVDIPSYNIDVSKMKDALSEKTKAVFMAHTLGNPFNISEVKKFCDDNNLWLIEDNCDALGSYYDKDGYAGLTGSFGDISTGSFYPPHHITMGEGGCVFTNDALLNRLILSYRDWGRDCVCPPGHDGVCGHRFDGDYGQLPHGYDHKYVYSHLGYNLKITDMQAAIGVEQLKKLPGFTEKRQHNWNRLRKNLETVSDKLILPEAAEGSIPSWFGFIISVKEDAGFSRNELTAHLESKNIQTRLLFGGNMLRQPCFEELHETDAYRVAGDLKNTDFIMNNSFWVGVYPGLSDEMTDYVADEIVSFVK